MKTSSKKESFLLQKFIQVLNQEMIPLKIIDTAGKQYATEQENIKHLLHVKDPALGEAECQRRPAQPIRFGRAICH